MGRFAVWILTAARISTGCCSVVSAPWFFAFDLLMLNGRDLRGLQLLDRQARLARILPKGGSRVLLVDGIMERGCDLFAEICARDMEGIVAKWAHGTYQSDGRGTSWLKIKNPAYTQGA